MLTHPTHEMLTTLGLTGMARAFAEMAQNPETRSLSHEEWLGLLLDRETTLRRQKRFDTRARAARLRRQACIEDIDFRAERGLDRALMMALAGCDYIRRHVFCSFLALVLAKEMKDRCAAVGLKPEWDRLIRDIDRLQSGDIARDGRTITVRTPVTGDVTGDVGPVFRAVGVALPPNIAEAPAA